MRYSTLEVVVMTLKQLAAAGHRGAAVLYSRVAERHGKKNAPDRPAGYIVIPEALTREEWEAMYTPKDDPPGDPHDLD